MRVNDGPTAEELAIEQGEPAEFDGNTDDLHDDNDSPEFDGTKSDGTRVGEDDLLDLRDDMDDEPVPENSAPLLAGLEPDDVAKWRQESPDSAALAEIAELEAECCGIEAEWLLRKESAKQAKECLDAAITRLRSACRRRQPTEADRAVDAMLAAGRSAQAPEAKADESWRRINIGILDEHGLSNAIHDKLHEAGIATIGDLSDWFATHPEPRQREPKVDGIGQAKAEKIEQALEKFWAANPQYGRNTHGPRQTLTQKIDAEANGEPDSYEERLYAEAAAKDKAVCAQPELKIQNHDPLPGQGSLLGAKPKPRRTKGDNPTTGGQRFKEDFGGGPHTESDGVA